MGLKDVYNPNLQPIFDAATDAYLTEIPYEDTLGTPSDLARSPSMVTKYVEEAVKANQDALRDIESRRRGIAYRSSVLMELVEGFSDLIATLPPETRKAVDEWAGRIRKDSEPTGESSDSPA